MGRTSDYDIDITPEKEKRKERGLSRNILRLQCSSRKILAMLGECSDQNGQSQEFCV